jgi:hypothetical protein
MASGPERPRKTGQLNLIGMPAKTRKQQRFMAMCSTAAGRRKARRKCPPLKVAKEFRRMR